MLSRLRQLIHHLNHSKALSTTTATGGSGVRVVNSNTACCSIPPVQSDYTPKGEYKEYAGFKRVYVTGPKTSDIAIVSVFDIFGYKSPYTTRIDMLKSLSLHIAFSPRLSKGQTSSQSQ